LWLDQLTDDNQYWQAAYRMSHWFFGLNPHGIIFTTGSSRFNANRPHFRPFVSQAAPNAYGLLVGGPNSVALKGDQVAAAFIGKPPMTAYIDHQESYATNEVAINWQAAWASYLSLLVTKD
jgi:endoglucanase